MQTLPACGGAGLPLNLTIVHIFFGLFGLVTLLTGKLWNFGPFGHSELLP